MGYTIAILSLCLVSVINLYRIDNLETEILKISAVSIEENYRKAWEDGRDDTIQSIVAGACINHDDTVKCIQHFNRVVSNLEDKGQ